MCRIAAAAAATAKERLCVQRTVQSIDERADPGAHLVRFWVRDWIRVRLG
jgi:hypothetical protein